MNVSVSAIYIAELLFCWGPLISANHWLGINQNLYVPVVANICLTKC